MTVILRIWMDICMSNKHIDSVMSSTFTGVLVQKFLQPITLLKGYLHCQTINSQNVPSDAQVKNFFVS